MKKESYFSAKERLLKAGPNSIPDWRKKQRPSFPFYKKLKCLEEVIIWKLDVFSFITSVCLPWYNKHLLHGVKGPVKALEGLIKKK